jgi:hypothetical protein
MNYEWLAMAWLFPFCSLSFFKKQTAKAQYKSENKKFKHAPFISREELMMDMRRMLWLADNRKKRKKKKKKEKKKKKKRK